MKIIVTESQINRILYNYFDMMFDGAEFGDIKSSAHEEWIGFKKVVNDEEVSIVGKPKIPVDPLVANKWYWSGPYFRNAWSYFNVNPKEFGIALKNYLNDKYNLDVIEVI